MAKDTPAKLNRLEATSNIVGNRLFHGIGSRPKERGGIRLYIVAILSAEQTTDWLVKCLARDIPKRDVCAGKHLHSRSLTTIITDVPIHLLPETFMLQGILAEEGSLE